MTGLPADSAGTVIESLIVLTSTAWRIFPCTISPKASEQQNAQETTGTEPEQ